MSYYKTKDGLFCGQAVDSDGEMVALRTRDGVSWFKRSDLETVPMAEALNLW